MILKHSYTPWYCSIWLTDAFNIQSTILRVLLEQQGFGGECTIHIPYLMGILGIKNKM